LDAWEEARLLGLLDMSLIDGYVGSFEAKYHYGYWRPVTAIRLAATDGNPGTTADPSWSPLVETPAIPDYDSGHAVEGGAAAQVLRRFFRTDHVRFSTCSTTLPAGSCEDKAPIFRRFASFSEAGAENGLSRILVGFHFRKAWTRGSRTGARSPTGPWIGRCGRCAEHRCAGGTVRKAVSPAHPRMTSQARRTSSSVVRSEPIASRST
jgi:PAP2 superfamily